jgi:hypothetical protein
MLISAVATWIPFSEAHTSAVITNASKGMDHSRLGLHNENDPKKMYVL